MKKLISVSLLIFAIAFIGCSQKVQYSEKFDYLPIIPGSELVNFIEGEGDNPDKAEYLLKESNIEKASSTYEDILTKNGWELSEDESKGNIYKFTKDEHWAVIIFDESGDDVKFTVISK